jgi:hypothetical protein
MSHRATTIRGNAAADLLQIGKSMTIDASFD